MPSHAPSKTSWRVVVRVLVAADCATQEAADAARSLAWLHWAVHVAFGQAAGQHLLPVLARGGSAKVPPSASKQPVQAPLASKQPGRCRLCRMNVSLCTFGSFCSLVNSLHLTR